MMDGQCVKLLPQVCDVLADSGKSLPDDTSLEKLLDWFGVLANSGKGLLETCPCLPDFISTVIQDTSPDASILSFTFRLTGLLAATESSFKQLQEGSALLCLVFDPPHRWHEAGFWEDPCVRIGWVQGIRAMLRHALGLSFLVDTDLIKVVLQLQTDSSLFVAAAANDVLADILVHQSGLSERFVDTDKSGAGTAAPMDADPQRLALALGSSDEYTSVAMVILEHVKASLVPGENGDLRGTLQGLRLLVLVFSQARAPLLGVLLETVWRALEALVAEGHSQLHLLLLDVLLTACSCLSRTDPTRDPDQDDPDPDPDPGQAASTLISRMLDSSKPPELIHTAAAILRSDHRDSSHRAQAAGLILLLLEMITGLPLPGAPSAGSAEQRSSLAELLITKTPCVSLLCVCLTHTSLLTHAPPDAVPFPIGGLVTAILSILRICSGHAPSALIGSAKACRNLIGCGKVQRCSLEALAALAGSPDAAEKMSEVSSVLIAYLDHPDSEPTVLHKSYQSLLKWISVCPAPSSFMRDTLGHDLLAVVSKRVCDVRWEVRDSTVEFLGQLALSQNSAAVCSFTPHLVEALQDTESYVRASAIAALAQTFTAGWQQRAPPSPEQSALVPRLLDVLSADTEGFPRRAVIRFFTSWLSSWTQNAPEPPTPSSSPPLLLMTSVGAVLSLGSADLDWEVKVHTLELARLLLRGALPPRGPPPPYGVTGPRVSLTPHPQGAGPRGPDPGAALASLVERGVVSALLSGLLDCDRPVALKACDLLTELRDAVCPPPAAAVATVTCELQGAWGQEVEAILLRSGVAVERGGGVGVCAALSALDLDVRRGVLARSSDHVHNSPLSLLQDILSIRDARADPTGQEVIVDCY